MKKLSEERGQRQMNGNHDGLVALSGIVEGLNLKMKLAVRKTFGFRSFKVIETALYHQMGDLPEPEFTHEFW